MTPKKKKKKYSRYNLKLIKRLSDYWENVVPEQRFCQLIANLGRHLGHDDIFYIEDDKLLEVLDNIDIGARLLLKKYKESIK